MKTISLFLLLALPLCINAQSLGGSLLYGGTSGEFSKFLKSAGGLNLEYSSLIPSSKTSMNYGFDISYLVYGYVNERSSIRTKDGYMDVDKSRTNSIAKLHGFLRAMGPDKIIRPYVEMIFGCSMFSSTSSVTEHYSGEELSSNWDKNNWAWSVGAGGGVLVKAFEPKTLNYLIDCVYIDLRYRYLAGSRTSYLREQDITVDNDGKIVFSPTRSKTDMYLISMGVQVQLNLGGEQIGNEVEEK